ncbi:DUF6193 family natural product biosynthesis protein [Streptomyces cinereoruber]|uniref:DUF6193 family natural product biosynthesis protein n=1 Tax=Streptomyces cinereoruber TaxID=67260 RepID=UPI00363B1588
MDFGVGLDRGDWDEDGALRAALGRTAEGLGLVHMPLHHGRTRPHALLAAAYAQPVLRRLMPVNSHFNLWFSTSVKEAWKAGIGYGIRPYDEDGLYAVRNRRKLRDGGGGRRRPGGRPPGGDRAGALRPEGALRGTPVTPPNRSAAFRAPRA